MILLVVTVLMVGLVWQMGCGPSEEAGCGAADCDSAGCGSAAAEARSALPVVPPPALSMVGQVVPSWN